MGAIWSCIPQGPQYGDGMGILSWDYAGAQWDGIGRGPPQHKDGTALVLDTRTGSDVPT